MEEYMHAKTMENINKTLQCIEGFQKALQKGVQQKNMELARHKKDAEENIELAESYYLEKQQIAEKLHQLEVKASSLEDVLSAKKVKAECLLQLPAIPEKYPDEFLLALMSAIHYAVDPLNQTGGKGKKSSSTAIRSQTVWNAFIQNNPEAEAKYRAFSECIEKIICAARQGSLTKNTALLKPFHLEFSSNTNNHYELHFDDGDDLYSATSGSTPSDTRSQLNSCRDIKNTFFF